MTEPLDMSKDPDRFAPDAVSRPAALDPALDPDRFDGSAVGGSTLPELLGKGSYEDERDNLTWLLGLVGVIAFLVLVSLLVRLR